MKVKEYNLFKVINANPNRTNTMKEKEIRAQINRISEQINIQKIYYSIKKINIMNYLKKENILKI